MFSIGRKSRVAQDAFEAGVVAFKAGDHAAAAEHFARALKADPEHAAAHQYAGGVAFHAGRYREAIEGFQRACRLAPDSAQCHFDLALAHAKVSDIEAARRSCETSLSLAPGMASAHNLLADLTLPGAWYLDLLARIQSHLKPRTYVEIGVAEGESIALAQPETLAIGVDPEPKIARPLGPRASVRAMTSDDYFGKCDVAGELGGLPIDLAFIDGMHRFEFALRDFVNLEKHCSSRSTILIHDCYPLNALTAQRERQTTFWSGDIWRLILILRKYRPDLRVNVIATAPTGLGVVRGLDPSSTALGERMGEIVREYLATDYSVLDADQAGMLALAPNDWERIKALLA